MAALDSQNKFSIENILHKDNGECKVSTDKEENVRKGGESIGSPHSVVSSLSVNKDGQNSNVSDNNMTKYCDVKSRETADNSNNSTTTSECGQLQPSSSQVLSSILISLSMLCDPY